MQDNIVHRINHKFPYFGSDFVISYIKDILGGWRDVSVVKMLAALTGGLSAVPRAYSRQLQLPVALAPEDWMAPSAGTAPANSVCLSPFSVSLFLSHSHTHTCMNIFFKSSSFLLKRVLLLGTQHRGVFEEQT